MLKIAAANPDPGHLEEVRRRIGGQNSTIWMNLPAARERWERAIADGAPAKLRRYLRVWPVGLGFLALMSLAGLYALGGSLSGPGSIMIWFTSTALGSAAKDSWLVQGSITALLVLALVAMLGVVPAFGAVIGGIVGMFGGGIAAYAGLITNDTVAVVGMTLAGVGAVGAVIRILRTAYKDKG